MIIWDRAKKRDRLFWWKVLSTKPYKFIAVCVFFTPFLNMYLCSYNLSPYHHIIHPNLFFFLLARTLNNALWKITHNCKSYTYPSARNRFYFSFIQRYSMDQPCWHWKHMFLYPLGKMQRTWNWTDAGPKENNTL